MIRTRFSVRRLRDVNPSSRTGNAEKLEQPGWLDVYLDCEETSAREALVGYHNLQRAAGNRF